ncbi:MAG TPA: sulfite exporter TauE/SafE family protein [Acidimicrobiia bacterium]|nr:sulfite exporter TauE/SafE family protein [Acidimicrobiia bacterium]
MSGPEVQASARSLLAIGVATGILAGLLGVGGGIIIVPALAALGYGRHQANAISLATILFVAVAGLIGFALSDALDVPVGLALGVGGLAGATFGAHWAHRLSPITLARFFGVLLIVAGIRLLVAGGTPVGDAMVTGLFGVAVAVVIGAVAGVVSGLAGIGGGVIMVPAMVFLLGLGQHVAEGTSLLAILFTAAAGTRVNVSHHYIEWRAVWLLTVTGVIFAPAAALFAQTLHADTLARLFGIWVLATAARTLWKSRGD